MKYFYLSGCLVLTMLQSAFSQCFPDRHSTNWFDGWVSCESFPNPNPKHGMSHWILYDFGQEYALKGSHIWNVNDPAYLDRGLRNVAIEYSDDGRSWTEAGSYSFAKGDGTSTYQGFTGPALDGITARYVLITALDNWGGTCYGLSEIRFEAEEVSVTAVVEEDNQSPCFSVQAFPNPFTTRSKLMVQSQCNEEINYRISDVLGRLVASGSLGENSGFHSLEINGESLPGGNYLVSMHQGGQFIQQHLLKID